MKKEDRRIIKSKTKIRQGLLELLKEKKLSSITVIELTSKASVNRKTFYNHYSGVYDVVHEMEDECLERIKVIFSKEKITKYKNRTNELFEMLLKEVDENEDFYRVMTHSDINHHFAGKLSDGVKEWLKGFDLDKDEFDMIMLEYYYDFISSGIMDVIFRWLQAGKNITSQQLSDFFNTIVWSTEVRKFFKVYDDSKESRKS